MIKFLLIIASIIFILLTWATSNVCNFNKNLKEKENNINQLKVKDNINLGKTEVYIFKELNCEKADLNYDISRLINNIEVISEIVYQYMISDISDKSLNK
jgi:hypothetical protein